MNVKGSREQRRVHRRDDPTRFVAFQARFYPPVAIPLSMAWLVEQEVIALWIAIVLGVVLLITAHRLIPWLVKELLEGPVRREGCGIAQFVYWAAPLLLVVVYWQGGWDAFLIAILALPALLITLAVFISMITQPRGRRR